jgi:hypothetical protein
MQSSHLPILPKDLAEFEKGVGALLAEVKWKPAKNLTANTQSQELTAGAKLWRPSTLPDAGPEDALSLLKIAKVIANDPVLLPESLNTALRAIRTGVSLGLYLARQYGVAAGLRELEELNKTGRLGPSQSEEFSQKVNTSAAVALFSAASYVVWKLGAFEPDKVSSARVEFHGIPEFPLKNITRAVACTLYYLAAYLDPQKNGLIKTDLEMVDMILRYFGGVMEEVKARQGSFKFSEFFTQASYQLADTDFTVQGFEAVRSGGVVSVEFNRQDFGAIVGNKIAKHEARRLATRLACYDLTAKKNPFIELGGLQLVRMGFGPPGTGKSLQISATGTYLFDLCKGLGIPFLFHPLPDNVVSTFQGGSAERMLDYMKRLQDADKIVYATIDDGENNLEDRTRQGVSAGVREVIGVVLRYTEGAYAINRGNSVVEIFTNLPEQIDKAVLSRVQSRFPLEGARTIHDFLDQDFLWWKKYHEIDPNFINMKAPSDYTFMADQASTATASALMGDYSKPKDGRIGEILGRLQKAGLDNTHHSFFAELYRGVQALYPNFTSRDVRNIQQAVSTRLMDFDLPPEWLEKPDQFIGKDYAAKLAMLKDLMRSNMGSLNFADIRRQEAVRYLDNMATIANIDRERQIERFIADNDIRTEAAKRIAALARS